MHRFAAVWVRASEGGVSGDGRVVVCSARRSARVVRGLRVFFLSLSTLFGGVSVV